MAWSLSRKLVLAALFSVLSVALHMGGFAQTPAPADVLPAKAPARQATLDKISNYEIVLAGGKDVRRAGGSLRLDVSDVDDVWAAGAVVAIKGNIKDNLWAAGGHVVIDSRTGEDVWAAGGDVVIRGITNGQVHAAGGHVNVTGDIAGGLNVAGGDVIVDSRIDGDLDAAGGFIRVTSDARIAEKISLAGASVVFEGLALDDLSIKADTVEIGGKINGNVKVAARKLSIAKDAIIGGDLHYRGLTKPDIAEGALISGETSQDMATEEDMLRSFPDSDSWRTDFATLFGGLLFTLTMGAFFFGLMLYFIFPALVSRLVTTLRVQPGKSFGVGFLVFFLTPIVAALLFFTVVGIPLVFVIFTLYPVLLFVGYVGAAFGVSDLVLNRRHAEPSALRRLVQLAVGLVVILLLVLVPFVGWWLFLAVFFMGLGAVSLTIFSGWRSRASAPQTHA